MVEKPERIEIWLRDLEGHITVPIGAERAAAFVARLRGPLLDYRDRRVDRYYQEMFDDELARISDSFVAFEQAYDQSSEETRGALHDLGRSLEQLAEYFQRVRTVRPVMSGRGGRPKAEARRYLAKDVGLLLRSLGVPIGASHNVTETFPAVLWIVLLAVGEPVPYDPYDVTSLAMADIQKVDEREARWHERRKTITGNA